MAKNSSDKNNDLAAGTVTIESGNNSADQDTSSKATSGKSKADELSFIQRLLLKIGGITIPKPSETEEFKKLERKFDEQRATIDSWAESVKSTIEGQQEPISAETIVGRFIDLGQDAIASRPKDREQLRQLRSELDRKQAELNVVRKTVSEKDSSLIEKDAEIEKLKKKLQELNEGLHASEESRKSRDKELQTLRKEKSESETRLRTAVDSAKTADNRNAELARNLKVEKERANGLQDQLDTLSGKKEALEKECVSLKDIVNKLNEKEESLARRIEEIEATDAGIAYKKVEEVEGDIKEKIAEIESLKAEVDRLHGSIESLNSRISSEISKNEVLTQNYYDLQDKLDAEHNNYIALNSANENLERQLSQKKKEIEERDERIISLNDVVSEKNGIIAGRDEEIKNISADLKDANEEIENLDNEIAAKEDHIKSLLATIDSKDNEIGEFNQHLCEAKATAASSVRSFYEAILADAEAVRTIFETGGYLTGVESVREEALKSERRYELGFDKLFSSISNISPEKFSTVDELKEEILELFKGCLESDANILALIGRQIGYSQMPFIRDDQGEEYMILNYKSLAEIERHIRAMLSAVGIQLIIPVPFRDRVNEGDFEAVVQVNNLDAICPNSRSHLDRVDRPDKDGIITDISSIGYQIPGQPVKKATVIL